MEEISPEEQRVIQGLAEFWQTHSEPHDLIANINRLAGSSIGTRFFRRVYNDLRTDKRSKYTAFSASEFRRSLELTYHQKAQEWRDEEQDRIKKEQEQINRTEFYRLGEKIKKTTNRAELQELGRQRAELAPYTGLQHVYTNHCWACSEPISSTVHARCSKCKFYFCGSCNSCMCDYPGSNRW